MEDVLHRKYLKSLENLLQSKNAQKVLSDVIDDLSGKNQVVRWKTIFSNGLFILSHPADTWNIYQLFMVHNDILASTEFQLSLLQKDVFWDMLKSFGANKLPQISEVIYNLTNISYFKKGNILDPQSLGQLKEVFSNKEELVKLKDIATTYLNQDGQNTGEQLSALQKILSFVDQSEEFRKFYQDNKSKVSNTVNDIMLDLMKQQPVIKYYLGDAKLGQLVTNIVDDTKKLKALVESASILNEKQMNPIAAFSFSASLAQIAYNRKQDLWDLAVSRLQGEGYDVRKALVNQIFENFNDISVSSNNLSDIAKSVIDNEAMLDEIRSYQQLQDQDVEKAKTLLDEKMLFSGVNIEGISKLHPKNLDNAKIDGENFIGTSFTNVSLQGASITNSQFYGATFNNVNLQGAKIDGETLATMLPGLKKSKIALENVKITGSIPEFAKLEGVSFKGADLSELKSFGGADLAKAHSLRQANFGNNHDVILTGENNSKLIHLTQFSTKEVDVLNKISDKIARNLFQDGVEGNRKEDAQIVSDIIIEAASNLKGMFQEDLSSLLQKKQDSIVGTLATGVFTATGSGLSKIFYDATKHTTVGYLSGGVMLNTASDAIDKLNNDVTRYLLKHVPQKSHVQRLEEAGAKQAVKVRQ